MNDAPLDIPFPLHSCPGRVCLVCARWAIESMGDMRIPVPVSPPERVS